MIIQNVRENFNFFAQSDDTIGAVDHSRLPVSFDGDQLLEWKSRVANKYHESIKYNFNSCVSF